MQICTCGKEINKKNLKKHLLSKFHLENSNENIQEEENDKPQSGLSLEIINNDNIEDKIMDENEYLGDFNNTFKFDEVENIVSNDKKTYKKCYFR